MVQVLANIITRLELYPGTSDDTPVNIVWLENNKTTITSQTTIKLMRSGTLSFEEEYNFQTTQESSIKSDLTLVVD